MPSLTKNLLSVGSITDKGHVVVFDSNKCFVNLKHDPKVIVAKGLWDNSIGLYKMNCIEQHKMSAMRALAIIGKLVGHQSRMRARWSFGIKSWATWALKICNPWANTSWWVEYLLSKLSHKLEKCMMIDRPRNELQKQAPVEHENYSNQSTLTFTDHFLHCHSKDQSILLCSPMTTTNSLGFIFLEKIWKFGKIQGIQKIGWKLNRKKSQSLEVQSRRWIHI